MKNPFAVGDQNAEDERRNGHLHEPVLGEFWESLLVASPSRKMPMRNPLFSRANRTSPP